MRLTIFLGGVLCTALAACEPAQDKTPLAGDLDWLMGCWQTADGGTIERWQAGSPTHFFGSSVTMSGGETVFFEQLRIEMGADGLNLFAYPRGVGPSRFDQTHADAGTFTVENAVHDYPQKITYRRNGDGLAAVISMVDDSNPNSWDYKRCGA